MGSPFVRLETGLVDNADRTSALLEGKSSYSTVFTKGSTAWTNMLDVLTGEPAMLYTAPHDTYDSDDYTGTDYPMQDPDYTPPTVPTS